jgi:hypothetical protein
MRTTKFLLTIALALALITGVAFTQISPAFAQNNQPVGVVIDYVPGLSITIVDQRGDQNVFTLSTNLKILPPGRADSLAVGSFVTIIAPASISSGKQTAVGIVVHPQVPDGWNVPIVSPTAFATETANVTETYTPIGTITAGTVTPDATFTETPTVVETTTVTETVTATPEGTITETPTATPTPASGTTGTNTSFVEWLRTILRQILSNE